MFYRFKLVMLLFLIVFMTIACGLLGGCSSEHYKTDADKEVYNIIENKWRQSFGQKVNYRISDVSPSPNDIRIDNIVSPNEPLSLAKTVAIATAYNRDYQTQKEELYLTALDLTLERYQFARQWFGTFDAGYAKEGDDNRVDSGEQLNTGGELGFNQLLADGAQISTSIALDWARFLTGDPRTSLGSVLSATISQPLLRGAGRQIAQEELTQAERDVLYEIRRFNRFRKTFVVSIVTDYYRVLQLRDAMINAENNYRRVLETQIRLEAEAEVGRKPRFEVDQAEQNALRAKDGHVSAQQRYEQRLDEFKIRLTLPTDAEIQLDQNELNVLSEIGVTEPDYTPNAAIETALIWRLDLATSGDRLDDAARKIMVAADNLGAELNIIGGIGVGSAGKTDFGKLEFERGRYEIGIEADLPLDRKAERNAYRKALIILKQQQRQYDKDTDEVILDVRDAYRQLTTAAEQYRIAMNGLELARQRIDSTELLLETGRARTRDLLESQDALLDAENDVSAALVDHVIAKLNFFKDIEVLQVKPDGMWVE